MIDESCRDYKGNDISEDVQEAIDEARDMARNAYVEINTENRKASTVNLLRSLFGTDSSTYSTASLYFAAYPTFHPRNNIVVICGDSMIELIAPDALTAKENPHGEWRDNSHGFIMHYDDFVPCHTTHQLRNGDDEAIDIQAYTVLNRLIYLCPLILDDVDGRTLAPYRDEDLAGEWIDDFALLPLILLHELYHTHLILPHRKFLFHFPPP